MKKLAFLTLVTLLLIGCSNSLNEKDKQRLRPIVENALEDIPEEMEKILKSSEQMDKEAQRISAGNTSLTRIATAFQEHQNVIAQANNKIGSKCIMAAEMDKQLSRLFMDVAKTISGNRIPFHEINYANIKFQYELFARLDIDDEKFYSWADKYKETAAYKNMFEEVLLQE